MEGIEESETWPDGSVTWVSTTKMPLRNQSGRIVGTYGISRDITARKEAQLALAEQTQLLHKKNQQIEDELKMARELQLAMLPQDFPCLAASPESGEALKFYSYYMPSGAVSGDFFDVFQLSDTAVGIFICDVMGHDVRAALAKLYATEAAQRIRELGDRLSRDEFIKLAKGFRSAVVPRRKPGRQPKARITAAYLDWKAGPRGVDLCRKHIPGWEGHNHYRKRGEQRELMDAIRSRNRREKGFYEGVQK